jgi:hypothetical protein
VVVLPAEGGVDCWVSEVDCMEEGMRVGGLGMVQPKIYVSAAARNVSTVFVKRGASVAVDE